MSRRTTLPAAAALLAVLAAGCTGEGGSAGGGAAARPDALQASLQPAAAAPQVAEGSTPGPLSVALSRSLFASSPVVVVARADDAPGLQQARTEAERLGVPLLVQEDPGPAAEPALVAEAQRLEPQAVLAVGAAGALTGLPGRVVTTPGDLPEVTRPAPADATVLVPAEQDPAAQALAATASATARAAGATVVPVAGGDPRSASSAVAAAPRRVVAAGSGFGPADRLGTRLAVAATGRELPGGGQVMFPGRRLVALYGTPGSGALGVLGEQDLAGSIARAKDVAAPYGPLSDVPVVPTFEIIVTVASASAGRDGNYSSELDIETIRPWVEQAGREGVYVVLDLQSGRTDFLTQAKEWAPLLELPHVGLALDPEWRLGPDQRPLQQIGSVGVDEVNSVVTWLADLTARAQLPQKLLVLHQFRLSMLRDTDRLDTSRDELAVLIHMDGQGATGDKDATWAAVTQAAPPGVTFGWKNFYDEDAPILTPAQTMTRRPTPVMISYQ